jgi:hypothetical protein
MGFELIEALAPDILDFTPPFELGVRLLAAIPPGETIQATGFQTEEPNQRKGHLGGYSVELALGGEVLAGVSWQKLREVSDYAFDVLDGTDQASGSFHCLPTCFTAGVSNPIGLGQAIFYRLGPNGRADKIWAVLKAEANGLLEQGVVADELGWWMGAAVTGKRGVTINYTHQVKNTPRPDKPLYVVAARPKLRGKRIPRGAKIPVRVVNAMGRLYATFNVLYVAAKEASEAGMRGELRDEEMARLETQIQILHGKGKES